MTIIPMEHKISDYRFMSAATLCDALRKALDDLKRIAPEQFAVTPVTWSEAMANRGTVELWEESLTDGSHVYELHIL